MPKTSAHLLSRKESERRRAGRSPGKRERVGRCVRAYTCVCIRARKSDVRDKKLRGANDGQTKRIGPPCARTRHYAVDLCDESLPVLHLHSRLSRFTRNAVREIPRSNNINITSVCTCVGVGVRVRDTREKEKIYRMYLSLLIKSTRTCQKVS
ncbi:hypothetical protein DBV15_07116 [Temnothorax longispinosus]|uniref:Uncharacterized protein n=1 Tax=Temnothorax longispinosus TaxID=300112 RepID=A0A4S2KRT6_9HYME|nr:hypothetical protein DBV15_07116 [Temnothorax longispinosus]